MVLLYWVGPLSISQGSHLVYTILLYPVYLLTVAVILGVWLGYDTDERNLERVYEPVDVDADDPMER